MTVLRTDTELRPSRFLMITPKRMIFMPQKDNSVS